MAREHGQCVPVPSTRVHGIVVQCFLTTRPVDTDARYTLPVFTVVWTGAGEYGP